MSYSNQAKRPVTNLIGPIECDRYKIRPITLFLASSFQNAYCGLITRRILEMNPKDFETVPSGVSDLYFVQMLLFFLTFLAKGAEGSTERGAVLPARLVSYQRQSHHGRSAAHVLTANSQRSLEKAKSKEGSWSLASSSASLALRLQSASLSFCLIGADGEEGRGGCCAATTCSPPPLTLPSHSPPSGQRTQMAQATFAQDPGSASDGGRARCHSSRADVTWSLRCEEGAGARLFKYLFSFYSSLYLPSLMSLREGFFFCLGLLMLPQ